MGSMTTAAAGPRGTPREPSGARLSRADLDALPDDGLRHELLDGAFVMTPSPGFRHQRAVWALGRALEDVLPPSLLVLPGPFDLVLPTGDVLVPDLMVVERGAPGERDLAGVPLIVVEALSPSTRRRDLGDKLTAYRDAGVPHYWIVDPAEPRLLVHELRVVGGRPSYDVVLDASGGQAVQVPGPVPVVLDPDDLLR